MESSEIEPQPLAPRPSGYGRAFWLAHLSSVLLVTGSSILIRYADFISVLGGNEFHLGWIVGIGMVGSLFVRLFLGDWIDRHGARPIWLGSLALFAASCYINVWITSCTGVAIYAARILFCCALAGVNGASMTFVGRHATEERLAELVGMLGTAGILGSAIGSSLSDLLLGSGEIVRGRVDLMFWAAGSFALAAAPFAWLATGTECRRKDGPSQADIPLEKKPSLLALVRQYHSGLIFTVGVAMGVGLGLPHTFLRTYGETLGIPRVGLFFAAYAVSAVITRLKTRKWFERFGTRNVTIMGTAGMVGSLLLLLPVRTEWQWIIPGVAFGWSQAVLFPAIIAAGAVTFPHRNRGLAMVLALATWDIGILIGSPIIGALVRYSPDLHLPEYPTMLLTISCVLALIGAYYTLATRKTD